MATVSKEFKKATREERAMRDLEQAAVGGVGLGKGNHKTKKKKAADKTQTELTKVMFPALVAARKRGRRISQIKIDNARERDHEEAAYGMENTFGMVRLCLRSALPAACSRL